MNKDLLKKAGKMFVCGFPGTVMDDHARFCSDELMAGNWILFIRNAASPGQLKELNGELRKRTLEAGGFEPFITVDQEGGIVSRLHGDMNHYPGAMACAAAGSEHPERTARIMAAHLKAMGFNMNLAPVADINSNPVNPIVGPRSYGDNPRDVSERVLEVSRAHLEKGVIPVLKHFPGHGDTETDSHLELPKLPYTFDQLEQRELIPFIRGIDAGLPAMMVAHMNIPSLDSSGTPSSLSEKVIKGLLRNTLGFEGLVLTDCLEMKGIRSHYSVKEAARMSIAAGADMLFVSHTAEEQEEGVKAVYDDLVSGRIKESRIDRSIARMEEFRKRYTPLQTDNSDLPMSWPAADLELLRDTSRRSLTVIRDKGFFSSLKDEPKLLILNLRRPEQFIGENTVSGGEPVRVLKEAFPRSAYRKIKPEKIAEELNNDGVRPEEWDRILILCSDLFLHPEAMNFVKELLESQTPCGAAVMRTPYEAGEFGGADGLLLCYEDTLPAWTSLRDFLKGEFRPEGICPVGIPGID
ncbi:MAG: glycoside hydrolase family 3 protein [Spirochaetales bacterium]|nr:glycoside hydrolase family 3 protein [Spirochaetales bacterium]